MKVAYPFAAVALLAALSACSGDDGVPDAATDLAVDSASLDATADASSDIESPDTGNDTSPTDSGPDIDPDGPGSCRYDGPATGTSECKAYGEGWTREQAQADCAAILPETAGTWAPSPCPNLEILGTCSVAPDGEPAHQVIASGLDLTRCNLVRAVCLLSTGGTFEPGPFCKEIGSPTAVWGAVPFVHPFRMCVPAKDGEPDGQTDGLVCTWTLISGCTEEGRRFQDYGYCPDVITQRPYSPRKTAGTDPQDPRLQDADYMAEVAWAARQVDACGCTCCHKESIAPRGAAGWYIDAPGIWLDGLPDSGLALFAGFADSRALGAFPPESNNGFNRTDVGIPTNDVPRMKALLEAEMVRRGLTEEEARKVPAFGGPLVEQFTFVPELCDGGEGVAEDGSIYWGGIDARYLYIMESDALGPVVPPNLDLPAGTIWRIDVPNVAPAFAEANYGQVSGDQIQVFPAQGAPEALESGKTYYIYVLIDVGLPITRCLFIAP